MNTRTRMEILTFTSFMEKLEDSVETYEYYFIERYAKTALMINEGFEYSPEGVSFSYEAEEYGMGIVTVGGSLLSYTQVEEWLNFVAEMEKGK